MIKNHIYSRCVMMNCCDAFGVYTLGDVKEKSLMGMWRFGTIVETLLK